ncbi:MAG: hypothetical protein DRJ41_04480 [Thermoprotei archaeon]|nr:MAG: hypothetical protein DRJ41_04480 [Thermoprotei archaeon]
MSFKKVLASPMILVLSSCKVKCPRCNFEFWIKEERGYNLKVMKKECVKWFEPDKCPKCGLKVKEVVK